MSNDKHPEYRKLLHRILRNAAQTNAIVLADLRDCRPDRTKLGSFMSFFALGRLIQSFRSASYLIKRRYAFEATVVMRLIFEQLAWVMAIHDKRTKQDIRISPPKCITKFNSTIEYAGRLYGQLSEVSHLNPKYIRDYLEFELGETSVHIYVRPATFAEATQCSLVLLLLAGLYGLMVEFVDTREVRKYRFLDRKSANVELSTRFLSRCEALQTRLDRLNKYLANPPVLTLLNSRGDGA